MQERIKEHDRDIRFARTQNFPFGTKSSLLIVTLTGTRVRRVNEAIHVRPNPNNINRDSEIEIPEGWIPTIKKHNSRSTTKRTYEGTTSNSRNTCYK